MTSSRRPAGGRGPSLVGAIAVLAPFVAVGGTSYAAGKRTGRDIRDRSLTGQDLRNGSVTAGTLRGLLVLGVTAVGLCGPARAEGAPTKNRCAVREHDRRVATSKVAMVYLRQRTAQYSRLYGCFKRTGRTIGVGEKGAADLDAYSVPYVVLRGSLVGVEQIVRGRDGASDTFSVTNLRTAKLGPAFQPWTGATGPERGGQVGKAVFDGVGRVAWTVRNPHVMGAPSQVYALAGELPVCLDPGPDVQPRSLSLAGGELMWTSRGTHRRSPPTPSLGVDCTPADPTAM